MRPLQLLDPAVHRRQQPVLLIDHLLPHRGVDEQIARRLRAVGGAVLDAAGRHRHPQDVVVGDRVVTGPALQRGLEEHAQAAGGAEREGVLQGGGCAAAQGPVGVVAVLVSVADLVADLVAVLGARQFAQRDAAQCAVLGGAAEEGVLGALDRAEQQGAGFEPAEEVPVAFLDGVDGEEVESAAGDQPQDVRAFQGDAAQAGAVDGGAQCAHRLRHRVELVGSGDRGRVGGCHVSAP